MAKPVPVSIPFTRTSPQQNFKLLELPPELVELLSSDQAPVLQLKSPSPSSLPCATTGDYVNLCTPTQTYSLRQVQSSNSIFLTKPLAGAGDEWNGAEGYRDATVRGDDDGLSAIGTVTAIALCNATLELQKLEAGDYVLAFLQQSLHVYESARADADALGLDVGMRDVGRVVTDIEKQRAKIRVFADVPLSIAECERGWVEICGFVHYDHVSSGLVCWRPSASVRLEVWERILEASVLQGINLEEQFLVGDLWKAVAEDDGDAGGSTGEEPFPQGLFEAIVRRLSFDTSPGTHRQDYPFPEWACFPRDATVQWIGETYIEATAPSPATAIGRSQFLDAWRDLLPEAWRMEASREHMKNGPYQYPAAETVCFKPTTLETQKDNKARRPLGTRGS